MKLFKLIFSLAEASGTGQFRLPTIQCKAKQYKTFKVKKHKSLTKSTQISRQPISVPASIFVLYRTKERRPTASKLGPRNYPKFTTTLGHLELILRGAKPESLQQRQTKSLQTCSII